MPFVKRNREGRIEAIYNEPRPDAQERVSADAMEIFAFLGFDPSRERSDRWTDSDLALVRVVEDLVEILMEKGAISFNDLPPAAQKKLISRRGLRGDLGYLAKLLGDADEVGEGDAAGPVMGEDGRPIF